MLTGERSSEPGLQFIWINFYSVRIDNFVQKTIDWTVLMPKRAIMASNNKFLAFITGAALGTGAAILYAPKPGWLVRRGIAQGLKDARVKWEERVALAVARLSQTNEPPRADYDDVDRIFLELEGSTDDVIQALELKLEELKLKNAQFTK